MQREQFNPDIEIKFQQLLQHMNQKNSIVQEFIRILRQICDAEIFYSRSMDKFANNLSKLIIGKDPLKQVFIIFERAVAAKSEQALELANNIKDDMIPFIESQAIDHKQQLELKNKQKIVKDIRAVVTNKLRSLRLSENNYRRSYQQLKRFGQGESRAEIEERQKLQKLFNSREAALMESINSYNHTVQEYLLQYTAICEKLSDIETKRKTFVRDAINKYMIFEISCIKNLEYNVPRYMKSLEKMNERLIIQDKIGNTPPNPNFINLAKISIANYIAGLNDRDKIDIPNSHKRILDIKKNTDAKLVADLYSLLDETILTNDVRVLKEIVYFSRNVRTDICLRERDGNKEGQSNSQGSIRNNYSDRQVDKSPQKQSGKSVSESSLQERSPKSTELLLLDAIMCHAIFQSQQFWNKYQHKLFDIIDRESRSLAFNNKEHQISLNFLAADIEFLRLVAYHPLPAGILAKFIQTDGQEQILVRSEEDPRGKQLQHYIARNERYLQ